MNSFIAQARSDWLSPQGARFYNSALAGLTLAFLAAIGIATVSHLASRPVALDFAAFWAAARLAVEGHALAAYDPASIEIVERAATDMTPGYLAFYYPPPFLLLILPLGLMGYSTALACFLGAEMALVLAALRRILPNRWAWLPLLSFPGFLMNGLSGQNAALSAACFIGGAVWLERRPLLAGACLGALTCKPQLAACVPVALLCARRWQALAGFSVVAVGLAFASAAVFGAHVWQGFLSSTALARTDIETISIKWPKMQSVFGAIRLFGGSSTLAYTGQIAMSLTVIAVLALVCYSRPGRLVEVAALATASLLFTPFLYDYDLAILVVPLACVTALAGQTGWRSWEQLTLVLAYVLPAAARPAGILLNITLGPPLMAALLLVIAKRALTEHLAAALHARLPALP